MNPRASLLICLGACAPAAAVSAPPRQSGSSLVVNMNPQNSPPRVVGAYDFELLGEVTGSECAEAFSAQAYWVGLPDLDKMSADPATRQAIAAAALAAIAGLEGADTMVVTRVVTTGKSSERVCATVFGRGIKLVKAAAPIVAPPAAAPPTP